MPQQPLGVRPLVPGWAVMALPTPYSMPRARLPGLFNMDIAGHDEHHDKGLLGVKRIGVGALHEGAWV